MYNFYLRIYKLKIYLLTSLSEYTYLAQRVYVPGFEPPTTHRRNFLLELARFETKTDRTGSISAKKIVKKLIKGH